MSVKAVLFWKTHKPINDTVLGMVTSVIALLLLNASSPMVVRPVPQLIVFSDKQPSKAPSLMVPTLAGSVTDVSDVTFAKASALIDVTPVKLVRSAVTSLVLTKHSSGIAVILHPVVIVSDVREVLLPKAVEPRLVKPEGNVTVLILALLKASAPILVTFEGIVALVSAVQSLKAATPIDVTLSGIVIDDNLTHPWNDSLGTAVCADDKVTELKTEQPENIALPKPVVMLFGIFIALSCVPANAKSPMDVTDSGMVIPLLRFD